MVKNNKTVRYLTLVAAFTVAAGAAQAEDTMAIGNTTITGSVSSLYTFNLDAPEDGTNAYRVFDYDNNSFNLNFAEVAFEGMMGDRAGYRIDLSAGSDVNIVDYNETSADDQFSVQQAYVSYNLDAEGKYSIMGGKFVTLHGAEVIESAYNMNSSRAFAFGYAIPFYHTGVMLTAAPNDMLTIKAAVVNGWDMTTDNNEAKTLHASVGLAPTDKISLSIGGSYGAEQPGNESLKRTVIDIIASLQATDELSLMVNADMGSEEEVTEDGDDASWTAIAAYLHYQKEKWGATVRAEMFDDADGYRTGVEQQLSEVTLTGHLYLAEGYEFRPEFRYDMSDEDVFVDGDGEATDKQMTLSGEFIASF